MKWDWLWKLHVHFVLCFCLCPMIRAVQKCCRMISKQQQQNTIHWAEVNKQRFENCSMIQMEGKVFFSRVVGKTSHRLFHNFFFPFFFLVCFYILHSRRARLFYFFIIVLWILVFCAKWAQQHLWRSTRIERTRWKLARFIRKIVYGGLPFSSPVLYVAPAIEVKHATEYNARCFNETSKALYEPNRYQRCEKNGEWCVFSAFALSLSLSLGLRLWMCPKWLLCFMNASHQNIFLQKKINMEASQYLDFGRENNSQFSQRCCRSTYCFGSASSCAFGRTSKGITHHLSVYLFIHI